MRELRKRGIVDTQRPVRLTTAGRDAVRAVTGGAVVRASCPACGGRGVVIPAELAGLADRLQPAADGAPGARAELDQTHCTVPTKISRVLRMHEARALAGQRIVLLGDDDLISVAIAGFAAWAGQPAMIRRLHRDRHRRGGTGLGGAAGGGGGRAGRAGAARPARAAAGRAGRRHSTWR